MRSRRLSLPSSLPPTMSRLRSSPSRLSRPRPYVFPHLNQPHRNINITHTHRLDPIHSDNLAQSIQMHKEHQSSTPKPVRRKQHTYYDRVFKIREGNQQLFSNPNTHHRLISGTKTNTALFVDKYLFFRPVAAGVKAKRRSNNFLFLRIENRVDNVFLGPTNQHYRPLTIAHRLRPVVESHARPLIDRPTF